MKYNILVTQEQKMTLEGIVSIEADSELEAYNLVKAMSQEELEEKSEDWQQGDSSQFDPCGDIEVTDELVFDESEE